MYRPKEGKQTHHNLMSLFVSALKMLTVILYGDYISQFVPALSRDRSEPQYHWMSLVLRASHCRKQTRLNNRVLLCICVLPSPRCASFTNRVREPGPLSLPQRKRYRVKEASFKNVLLKQKEEEGRVKWDFKKKK